MTNNIHSINYNDIKTKEFDALIIGGGGSGMRASLELALQLFQKFSQQDHILFLHRVA